MGMSVHEDYKAHVHCINYFSVVTPYPTGTTCGEKVCLVHGFRLIDPHNGGGTAEQFRSWYYGGKSIWKRWFICQKTKEAANKEGSSKTFKGSTLESYSCHPTLTFHSFKDFTREPHELETKMEIHEPEKMFQTHTMAPLTPQRDMLKRNKNRPLKFPEDPMGFID